MRKEKTGEGEKWAKGGSERRGKAGERGKRQRGTGGEKQPATKLLVFEFRLDATKN